MDRTEEGFWCVKMVIKLVISDNDGCFGDFPKIGRPHQENLGPHIEDIDRIRDFLSSYGVAFSMCTGRSLTNSVKIIHELDMKGPSALEMGSLLYDPTTDQSKVLAYTNDFYYLSGAQDEIRRFLDYLRETNGSLGEIFGCEATLFLDRKNIVTVETAGKTGYEIEPELRRMMHPELESHIEDRNAVSLPSAGACDIMVSIGKGGATEYIMKLTRVGSQETLSIGDSFHTDAEMMAKTRYVGCPANADRRIREYVTSKGADGYISPHAFADGVLDILQHASRSWGLQRKQNYRNHGRDGVC